jgi:TatD DNase family protein
MKDSRPPAAAGGLFLMAIDSHCHLTLRFERKEVPDVLSRACQSGVTGILLAGYCPMHNARVREILDNIGNGGSGLPSLAGTAGIHPHEADKFGSDAVDGLNGYLEKRDIVAIGETGLDFFREYADHNNQLSLFRAQVKLASETGYPLIIHSRDAFEDTVSILKEFKLPEFPGVFHCFGYDASKVSLILDMGFYISFAGMLTYPQSKEIQDACAKVPLDRLLTETDSPYQIPQKAKNRKVGRNEPQYVVEVLKKAAELHNMSAEELESVINLNTINCFPRLRDIPEWANLDTLKTTEGSR